MSQKLPYLRGPWDARSLNENFRRLNLTRTRGEAGGSAGVYAVKSVAESRNATTTYEADDELWINVSDGRWLLSGLLLVTTTSSTPDMKARFTGIETSESGWVITPTVDAGSSSAFNIGATSSQTINLGNGTHLLTVTGLVRVNGGTGRLELEWAQNTSNPSNVTINAYSWISAAKPTSGTG